MPKTVKSNQSREKSLTKPLVVYVQGGSDLLFGKNEASGIAGFFSSSSVGKSCTNYDEKYEDKKYWSPICGGHFRSSHSGLQVLADKRDSCFTIRKIIERPFCAGKCPAGRGKATENEHSLVCTC